MKLKLQNADEISLTGWHLESAEQFAKECERAVLDAATEALRIALDSAASYAPSVELPDNPNQPLEIRICADLGSETAEPQAVTFSFDLKELIDTHLLVFEDTARVRLFGRHLRQLVDEIDRLTA